MVLWIVGGTWIPRWGSYRPNPQWAPVWFITSRGTTSAWSPTSRYLYHTLHVYRKYYHDCIFTCSKINSCELKPVTIKKNIVIVMIRYKLCITGTGIPILYRLIDKMKFRLNEAGLKLTIRSVVDFVANSYTWFTIYLMQSV